METRYFATQYNLVSNISQLQQWYDAKFSLQWRHNGRHGVSNHQLHDCLLNRLPRRRSKEASKVRVTGLCAGNSTVGGDFTAQMSSNAENASIWWRHHVELGTFAFGHEITHTCVYCVYHMYLWGEDNSGYQQFGKYKNRRVYPSPKPPPPFFLIKMDLPTSSSIRRTKFLNLNVSRLVLQLSLPNRVKPGVESSMKIWLEQRWHAMLQLHLSDQQVFCYTGVTYIRSLVVILIPNHTPSKVWDVTHALCSDHHGAI